MTSHNERVVGIDEEKGDVIDHIDYVAHRKDHHHLADDAAEILEQAGDPIEITEQDRKRVLRKIDFWVAVPLCIVYTIQSMDKATLAYASVFNLLTDTHLVGQQYSWLSSAGYVAQLLFQSTSAYALVIFPVKYWVLFNMTAWCICTLCQAAATDFKGLMVVRIFLGIFEATILPSFGLIVQMWWTRREQSYRTVAYQVALSSAGIIGPLLTYGVGKAIADTHSPFKVYKGIFLFIGGLSLAFVPLIAYMLPNSPATARFLRHGNDRVIALERLRENNTGTKTSKWKWPQFWETMRDPKTWMWTVMMTCITIPQGGVGTFAGLIVKGFGFDSFKTTLMGIPPGVIGIIVMITATYIINRIKIRFIVVCGVLLPAIGGATGLVFLPRSNTRGLMGVYYTMYFYGGLQPIVYSWANMNSAGTTKRVVTTATMFIGMCAGNIVGPQVFIAREAPIYRTGLYFAIGCWSTLFIMCWVMASYLKMLNRKQAKKRAELGLPADLKDVSIMTLEEAEVYRAELRNNAQMQGMDSSIVYESAFDDMTDFQNPAFMYVI